jgi:hypothetical protein
VFGLPVVITAKGLLKKFYRGFIHHADLNTLMMLSISTVTPIVGFLNTNISFAINQP